MIILIQKCSCQKSLNNSQNSVPMAMFVWLVDVMKMKEELRFAVMDFGGLFMLEVGMFVMLQLFADN